MRTPRARYLRRRRFNRIRYDQGLLNFLADKSLELDGTGADFVFTVDPKFASATFTLSDLPADGDVVTIGQYTYRFKNALQQAYDVLIGPYIAATGTFELNAGTVVNNDTATIGDREYVFKTALTEPAEVDEILVGNGGTEAIANFVAAINGGEGEGVTYSEGTVPNADVTAEEAEGDLVVTARVAGEDGNTIVIAATTDGAPDWSEATLLGGEDPDEDDVLANLIAAINGGEGEGTLYGTDTLANTQITAAEVEGDMVVTAIFAGDEGNSIGVFTDIADGSWGEDVVTLEDGDTDASNKVTITSHGLAVHTGPFVVTAGTTLPLDITATGLYWIHSVVDANTVRLTTKKGSSSQLGILTEGEGTLTLIKAETEAAVLEYIKQNPIQVVRDATDADDL
jgi:hypothetical protein